MTTATFATLPGAAVAAATARTFHGAVTEFKRRLIEATLWQEQGNRTRAARVLGLQRTYLLRLMKEFGVHVPHGVVDPARSAIADHAAPAPASTAPPPVAPPTSAGAPSRVAAGAPGRSAPAPPPRPPTPSAAAIPAGVGPAHPAASARRVPDAAEARRRGQGRMARPLTPARRAV
jgi:hypothetical protein